MKPENTEPSKIESFAGWIIRWRWVVLIASVIGAVAIGSGARHIEFKNNYRIFFSEENPQLKSFDALQNIYTKDDNIMFVLAKPGAEVFSREYLQTIAWLTEEAWKLPFTTRVDSLTNFQHSEADGDDLIVDDLVSDPATVTEEQLAKIGEIAQNEPLLFNRLVGSRPHVTAINVTMTLPEKDPMEVLEAAGAARELKDRLQNRFPGTEVYMTGMVMLNAAFAEASVSDLSMLIPLMYVGIFVTMGLLLRSLAGTLSAILVIFFSTMVAMGTMGWIGLPMTPPVATAPTIIMTLAVADSIHVLVTFIHQLRRGRPRREALVESMRVNFGPIFLTSLTTAIGFLSMNFSDAPPFRHLGNVVAIGVWAAWLFSVGFLPAMLSVIPLRIHKEDEERSVWFDRFVNSIVQHRPKYLWGSVAAVVLLAMFIPRIQLNDQWVEYFDESIAFRTDSDFAMENLTGMYSIEYSIESGESSGINEPVYLQKLDEFATFLRARQEVRQVVTLSDTMKRVNKNLHGDDPSWYSIPDDRELAAQYLLLFEMSLPYGLDLNNQINVDKSATRFTATTSNLSTRELRRLIADSEQWQKENFPENMVATAASPSVMFAYISERNIQSMLGGTALAVLLISVILGIALRSVRYGFISLIPNFVPAILGFGFWGLFVGTVGMSLSVVTGMTLGIVVDDTVHFLSKYLRGRRERGFDAAQAIRYAFDSVGKAVVVTTVILSIGFSILSFSAFGLNSWMGQLTAIVIVFALFADFCLLPALLITFDRKKPITQTQTQTSQEIPYENQQVSV